MSNRTKLPTGTRKTAAVRKLPAWARKDVEDAIERLLAVLDSAEPDPDLEEDDPGGGDVVDEPHDQVEEGNDEPSLGSMHSINQETAWAPQCGWWRGCDREFDGETAPSADSEPSLGSANFAGPQLLLCQGLGVVAQDGDQTHWGYGRGPHIDAEEEHDGCEPDDAH
jgi:hypothetical protein